jgi:hypothetical protein
MNWFHSVGSALKYSCEWPPALKVSWNETPRVRLLSHLDAQPNEGSFVMTNHAAQSKVERRAEPLARNGQNAKAVEFLSLAGFTLHGNDWIVPLAGELAISPDEIQNWLSGETPLTLEDGIWPRVFKALRDRREKLTHVHDEIHAAFREVNERTGKWVDEWKVEELPVRPLHILR